MGVIQKEQLQSEPLQRLCKKKPICRSTSLMNDSLPFRQNEHSKREIIHENSASPWWIQYQRLFYFKPTFLLKIAVEFLKEKLLALFQKRLLFDQLQVEVLL